MSVGILFNFIYFIKIKRSLTFKVLIFRFVGIQLETQSFKVYFKFRVNDWQDNS